MGKGKGKNASPLEVKISYETACSLQSILTQQAFHIKANGNEHLAKEFDDINKLYEALTAYIERH